MESLSPTIETRMDILDAQAVKLACELRAAGDFEDILGELATLRRRIAQVDHTTYPALVATIDRLAAAADATRRPPRPSDVAPRSHVRSKSQPELAAVAKPFTKP